MTSPIPDGYPTVTPYLAVDGASAAIDFYKDMLGASERMRLDGPDGRVGHAELQVGGSVIMLADENPDSGFLGPKKVGGTPVMIHVYVDDVDAAVERAVSGGATVARPIEDHFYGDRSGRLVDPFGHTWDLATHVEDVPAEEMARRAAELAAS
jgi:PhnB protein